MGFPNGWLRRQTITIQSSKVAATQANFPVLLVWTGSAGTSNVDSDIVNSSNSWSANSNGSDIRCSSDSAGATQLPVEIVYIVTSTNTATARLQMYVNVSSVSSASNTIIYLWYGNSLASTLLATDTYGSQAVWNTNYISVWHMNNASGNNEPDSTANAHTAVNTGVTTGSGLFGGSARSFDGTGNTYFTVTGLLGSPAASTIMAIVNCTGLGSAGANIISMGDANSLQISVTPSENVGVYHTAAPAWIIAAETPTALNTGWANMAYSCNPTGTSEVCYVNNTAGTNSANATAISYAGLGANTLIGIHGNGGTTYPYTGLIEEIWVLNIAQPASWVTTIYNSLMAPNTFATTSGTTSVTPNQIFPNGWTRKATMTISHLNVPGDQTNFPVILTWNGTTGNLPLDIYNAGPNSPNSSTGADIRASTDLYGRNLVPIEIVTFSPNSTISSAGVEIHINLPSVSSATDTVFYLWWRCFWATALSPTDANGSQAVWTNCLGVWHMNQASGSENDSTSHANTAVNTGVTTAVGIYGGTARALNGSSDFFTVTGLLGNPATITLLAIAYSTVVTTPGGDIISLGDSVVLRTNTTGTAGGFYYNGTAWVTSYTAATSFLNAWVQFGYSCSPSVSHEIGYGNTTAGADTASATAISYTQGTNTIIGHHGNGGTHYFSGDIEEVRALSVYESATWITATYNNLLSPQTFVTVSSVNDVQVINFDQGAEIFNNVATVGSITTTITFGNGTNRAVFVGVTYRHGNGTPCSVSSVTINGYAMTMIVNINYAGSANTQENWLFWMPEANLPVGGTYALVVTYSAAAAGLSVIGSMSFWNVNQFYTNTGTATNTLVNSLSCGITTPIQNYWIVDCFSTGGGTGDPTIASTTGATAWAYTYTGNNFATGMSYTAVPGPSSANSAWSLSNSTMERLTLVNTTIAPYNGFTSVVFLLIGGVWYYVSEAYVCLSSAWSLDQIYKVKVTVSGSQMWT